MTTPADAPRLSRPVKAEAIPAAGLDYTIETSPAEREALAKDMGLVAILAFSARLRLMPERGRIAVTGKVTARVTQTCVATLDHFDADVSEPVDVVFADRPPKPGDETEDEPDLIENGIIDLGHVAAEFLALGLDPYPRKPGAAFTAGDAVGEDASPFAALKALKPGER